MSGSWVMKTAGEETLSERCLRVVIVRSLSSIDLNFVESG